jgi:hypothetical protein
VLSIICPLPLPPSSPLFANITGRGRRWRYYRGAPAYARERNPADEALSNFIPRESGAIGVSAVHLHNSRSATDRQNAHVAAHRVTIVLPVSLFFPFSVGTCLITRTPLLLTDARAQRRARRGIRGRGRTRFANSRLIEKFVRHENGER